MRKKIIAAAVAVSVPVIGLGAVSAAHAADPSTVLIEEMSGIYKGPRSSAGKFPKITIEATEVSRAFVSMTYVKTVRKVAKATDGEAEEKGTVVKTQGYRCKAKSVKVVNPGTAGMYEKVNWKCTFMAADTPTEITLTYRQAQL
jgi:hypothetical protein